MIQIVLLLLFLYQKPQPYQPVVEIVTVKSDNIASAEPKEIQLDIHVLEKKCLYSDEEIDLVALVMLAEAEGESEEGRRLVVDTILNRVDSEHFPNSIYDVIYQKNQFSSMWDGRKDRVSISDEDRELVRDELIIHGNTDVIFFTAGNYSKYGRHLYSVGNHYFSAYE